MIEGDKKMGFTKAADIIPKRSSLMIRFGSKNKKSESVKLKSPKHCNDSFVARSWKIRVSR